jgi:hypothetical protein
MFLMSLSLSLTCVLAERFDRKNTQISIELLDWIVEDILGLGTVI